MVPRVSSYEPHCCHTKIHYFQGETTQTMRPSIDGTEFGNITISGEQYEHDVVVRLSGKVKNAEEEVVEGEIRNVAQGFTRKSATHIRSGGKMNPRVGAERLHRALRRGRRVSPEEWMLGPAASYSQAIMWLFSLVGFIILLPFLYI